MERMLIAGAGALGSVYGGLLAAAGAEVLLVARGAHADAMCERGLELRLPSGTLRVPVRVAAEGAADTVLVTAKAFDTAAVLDRVRGTPALVVSFQNGLGKNDALADRFGEAPVVGGSSMVTAEIVEPGVVRSESLGVTSIGELAGGSSERVEQLAQLLRKAGLETRTVDDVRSVEWSKLAQVAAMMAVQVVSRRYVHEILLSPDGRALVAGIVAEVASIASERGVALADLPGLLPVASIARGPDAGSSMLEAAGQALRASGRLAYRTSLLQSFEAGRTTELEAIHGELVRAAADRGVRVPTLAACYRIARLSGA